MIVNAKKIAIVTGATGNVTFAAANVLMGIKKHSPRLNADFIIYQNDFSENDQNLLNQITPCKFIEYKFPIKEEYRFTERYFKRFTKMAFSLFECFNLLKEYDKVLWLDIDVLVQKDISDIFEQGEVGLAMAKEPCSTAKNFLEPPDFIIEADKEKSYNTGIVLFTNKIQEPEKIAERCYDLTYEYAKHLLLADQSTINLLLVKDNIEVKELSKQKYNCLPNEEGVKTASIVHAHGDYKFWNYYKFPEWNEHYKNWLKMGGSPYKGKKINAMDKFYKDNLAQIPSPIRQPKKFVQYFLKKEKA